jgi:hypothetical protein
MKTGTVTAIYAVLGLALAASIVWAFGRMPFWEGVSAVTANPWGIVTLVDLYVGFVMLGLLAGLVERWPWWIWPMMLASFILGNVVYAAWALVRLRSLAERLRA